MTHYTDHTDRTDRTNHTDHNATASAATSLHLVVVDDSAATAVPAPPNTAR